MRDEGIITTWDQSVNFNDPLKPESSINFNLGANYKRRKFILDTNLFYNSISNLIDTRSIATKTNGQNVFTYVNVNKVFTYGLELNAQYRLTNDLKFTAGYQYLIAKDPSIIDLIKTGTVYGRDGLETVQLKPSDYFGLFNRSRNTINAKVYYTIPEWKTGLALRYIYRSKYGLNDTNGSQGILDKYDTFVKGYGLVNFSVTQPVGKYFVLQAGANNIFDFTDPQYISNLPGRITYAKLQYNF